MPQILSLGAINKHTGKYVYPKIANKKDEYICPECNKDLILVQGKIIVHHFRHRVNSINPCHHYSKPNESQIHKDAKLLMKTILDNKTHIQIVRQCVSCKKYEEFEIPEITESSSIQLEHRFEYNGTKIADVAYIDDGDILCIFEICNTHKTCSENRPNNIEWFEIDAITLINMANNTDLTSLQIPCIRCEKCEKCEYVKITDIYDEEPNIYSNNTRQINRGIDDIYDIDETKFVYLNVEFSKKDMIKEYSGKWNKEHKLWYIKKSVYNKNKTYIDEFIGDKINWIYNSCWLCNGTGFFRSLKCAAGCCSSTNWKHYIIEPAKIQPKYSY
jgi:uncharacterized protein YkuJ